MSAQPNVDALKSEIRAAVINQKANACPMVARLAWHSSGTYNKHVGHLNVSAVLLVADTVLCGVLLEWHWR